MSDDMGTSSLERVYALLNGCKKRGNHFPPTLLYNAGRSLTGAGHISGVRPPCLRLARWEHYEGGTTLADSTEYVEEAFKGVSLMTPACS